MLALIFIGGENVYNYRPRVSPGLLGITLAHILAMAAMASIIGSISGGHPNPAVTLGLLTGAIAVGLMVSVNILRGGPFTLARRWPSTIGKIKVFSVGP